MLFFGKRTPSHQGSLQTIDENIPPDARDGRRFVKSTGTDTIEIQTDFGQRTCGILTEILQQRTVDTLTDRTGLIERSTETDVTGKWDVAIQNVRDHRDAATDIGEWNRTSFSSMDSQTDAPDLTDSLFWCTQGSMDMIPFILSILDRVDQDMLNTDPNETISKDKRDNLELRADNIMLRIEIAELKRRLKLPSPSISSLESIPTPILHRCGPMKASMTGLHKGIPTSQRFVVVSEDGACVTSSLAPSSYILGRLSVGDKILSSGRPEEIMDQLRIPVLPRGWITLRDSSQIYLKLNES